MAENMLDQNAKPTEEISVRDVFGIDTEMRVKGFAETTDRVPTVCIGFAGTGGSTA